MAPNWTESQIEKQRNGTRSLWKTKTRRLTRSLSSLTVNLDDNAVPRSGMG